MWVFTSTKIDIMPDHWDLLAWFIGFETLDGETERYYAIMDWLASSDNSFVFEVVDRLQGVDANRTLSYHERVVNFYVRLEPAAAVECVLRFGEGVQWRESSFQ